MVIIVFVVERVDVDTVEVATVQQRLIVVVDVLIVEVVIVIIVVVVIVAVVIQLVAGSLFRLAGFVIGEAIGPRHPRGRQQRGLARREFGLENGGVSPVDVGDADRPPPALVTGHGG